MTNNTQLSGKLFFTTFYRLVADIPFDPGFPIIFVSLVCCLYYVYPESAEEVVQEKDVWAALTWPDRHTLKKEVSFGLSEQSSSIQNDK